MRRKKGEAKNLILSALPRERENGAYGKIGAPLAGKLAGKKASQLSEDVRLRLFEALKTPLTFKELRKKTGLSKPTLWENLTKMVADGEVKGIVNRRIGYSGKLTPAFVKTGMFCESKIVPIEMEATKRGQPVKITLRPGSYKLSTVKRTKKFDYDEIIKKVRKKTLRTDEEPSEKGKPELWRKTEIILKIRKRYIEGEKHAK